MSAEDRGGGTLCKVLLKVTIFWINLRTTNRVKSTPYPNWSDAKIQVHSCYIRSKRFSACSTTKSDTTIITVATPVHSAALVKVLLLSVQGGSKMSNSHWLKKCQIFHKVRYLKCGGISVKNLLQIYRQISPKLELTLPSVKHTKPLRHFFPPRSEILSSACLYVCLFVCLSARISQNHTSRFHQLRSLAMNIERACS